MNRSNQDRTTTQPDAEEQPQKPAPDPAPQPAHEGEPSAAEQAQINLKRALETGEENVV